MLVTCLPKRIAGYPRVTPRVLLWMEKAKKWRYYDVMIIVGEKKGVE
jgi:hypothetical protein